MFEAIVNFVADAIPSVLVLLWIIGFIWQIKNFKKRVPGRSFFSLQAVNWQPRQKTCSSNSPSVNTDSVGSLTRESMFKDIDTYRFPQETTFDKPYTSDQLAPMEHNINGIPMSGGVDLHGNLFGSVHN